MFTVRWKIIHNAPSVHTCEKQQFSVRVRPAGAIGGPTVQTLTGILKPFKSVKQTC